MNESDRERWEDDHWDYQEQIGSRMAPDEDVIWCPICGDDTEGCKGDHPDEVVPHDPTEDDFDPTPDDYYDCPVEEV